MATTSDILFNSSLYPPTPPTTISTNYRFTSIPPEHQPYGQYAALAFNYLDLAGFPMPIKLPPILKTGGNTIQIFDRTVGTLAAKDPLNV
ncbi:MAG: hypothetical protein WCK88_03015 [bacterium]